MRIFSRTSVIIAFTVCQARMTDQNVLSNPAELQKLCQELHEAQELVDRLYQRWEELGW